MSSIRSKFTSTLRPKQGYTSQVERESRAQKKLQDRRNTRAAGFGRNRNIGELKENIEIELAQNKLVKDPQRIKLERWKEERKKLKLANAQKKPAFVCGIVKHKVGSPYWNDESSRTGLKTQKMLMCPKTNITNSRMQRTNTRGAKKQESGQKTEAMITIPANFKFKAPVGVKPLCIPVQPLKPRNTASSKPKPGAQVVQRVTRSMAVKAPQKCLTPSPVQNAQSKTVMAESAVNLADEVASTTLVMESVSLNQENSVCEAEENDREQKDVDAVTPVAMTSKDDIEFTPVHYSPFVTKERGSSRKSKGSSRKLMGGSRKSLLSELQSCSVSPIKQTTSDTEEDLEKQKEREAVVYFRNVLKSEVDRLELICENWLTLQNSTPDLPEEIGDLIDVAVGKARLLIKQKLKQFGTLISQCEAGSVPGMPGITVKCSDLEGFWDMVYMQVEDVDTKFKMLEDAKSKNWQKDEEASAQIPSKRGRKKPARKGKKEVVNSSLRAMIAAARKKNENAVSELASDASGLSTRRFSSPIIVDRSSARKSVLQQVLTTEAYKQSLTEIVNNPSTPILFRKDCTPRRTSVLQERSIMNNTSNISDSAQKPKSRQSSQKRLSRKVRFTEGETDDNVEKPVQPMTPYTNVRGLKRRRTSTINSEERKSMQKTSPSSPDISKISPIERPSRVLRRSRRLIDL